MYMISLGFNDKRVIEDYENLGEEQQQSSTNWPRSPMKNVTLCCNIYHA